MQIPYEIEKAIDTHAGHLADVLSEEMAGGKFRNVDECREYLHDMHIDDTLAIGLDLDDKLSVLEYFADDHGYDLESVTLSNLRSQIEGIACALIHFEACARVAESLDDFETFMEDEEIEFSQASTGNSYGWARHWAERHESECTIYEYRNVEETHVDLYEYNFSGTKIYFTKSIDPADVSEEERKFEAVF